MDKDLEDFRKEWFQVFKDNYMMTPTVKKNSTLEMYEAFEKMHKMDGTTEGSRWQPNKKKDDI